MAAVPTEAAVRAAHGRSGNSFGLSGRAGKWAASSAPTRPIAASAPCLVALLAKRLLHFAADRVPFALRNTRVDAAIGENFDLAVDQLHVDQDAAVFLGIPDAQVGKQLDRALPSRVSPCQTGSRSRPASTAKRNSPRWRGFGVADRRLDGRQRRCRKGAANRPGRASKCRMRRPNRDMLALPVSRGAATAEAAATAAPQLSEPPPHDPPEPPATRRRPSLRLACAPRPAPDDKASTKMKAISPPAPATSIELVMNQAAAPTRPPDSPEPTSRPKIARSTLPPTTESMRPMTKSCSRLPVAAGRRRGRPIRRRQRLAPDQLLDLRHARRPFRRRNRPAGTSAPSSR